MNSLWTLAQQKYAMTWTYGCDAALAPAGTVAENAELCGRPAAAGRGNSNLGRARVGGGKGLLKAAPNCISYIEAKR